MSKNFLNLVVANLSASVLMAQSFAPAAGQPGSTAIPKDSPLFTSWATHCEVERGWVNIEDQSLGLATHGLGADAVGPSTGVSTNSVSLGDGGTATLTFFEGIKNGDGPDFAVFENGVTDGFLELGFVEVSSDGERFVRFPAISEIQTETQVGPFGVVDCRYIHNFAGKYRAGFGTPFDLEDLIDSTGIDLENITHVRIVDVVGSIDPQYATYDSQGTIVNNLHPTPFESSGFDLEAVGVINPGSLSISAVKNNILTIHPNPANSSIQIADQTSGTISIYTLLGDKILEKTSNSVTTVIDVSNFVEGIYLVSSSEGYSSKLVIKK